MRTMIIALLIAGYFAGCAQNTEQPITPLQKQGTLSDQAQPQTVSSKTPFIVNVNGPATTRLIEALHALCKLTPEQIAAMEAQELRHLVFSDSADADAVDKTEVDAGTGAATFHQQNVVNIRQWADNSQAGTQTPTQTQTASGTQSTEQTIKAAVEAALSAAGIGQLQTTQSGATEGSSAATGGSMSQQMDDLIDYIKTNPDKAAALIAALQAALPTSAGTTVETATTQPATQ